MNMVRGNWSNKIKEFSPERHGRAGHDWMLYQNFWLAMGNGLTGDQAFTSSQQLRLANTYAVAVLLTMVFGAAYWKLIGLI